jgi:hypothetical protein
MPRRAHAWPPAGACLVGLIVTPARCSQAAAARTVLPPYAARAAQPPALPSAVNVWARSDAAYTERDDLRTLRTVIETSVQRADSAFGKTVAGEATAVRSPSVTVGSSHT